MFAMCGRSQSNDILLKVMAEIERRGVRLNSAAFNSMLAAMAQCGMVEEAFEEAEKVTEPTMETFGALLLVCAKNSIVSYVNGYCMGKLQGDFFLMRYIFASDKFTR